MRRESCFKGDISSRSWPTSEDIRGKWIDSWWGYSSWQGRFLQQLNRSYCTAARGYSDATAPGLTATSALTTWTAYLIGLWVINWSGLYFFGVKSTGFRSQLGVLWPNICQLMPPALLLAKISRLTLKIIHYVTRPRSAALLPHYQAWS